MPTSYSLSSYQAQDGSLPYKEWLQSLRDRRNSARIAVAMSRMEHGNFGDSKGVGEGVLERRLNFGPGYRVYYARYDECVVLLFCGGDKSSQTEDITRAKDYKRDFEARCL